jgi:AbrB family looped-hinge helix DNA binding protein
MEFAIAKVSTKGQIVIPSALRSGISTGDEFLLVKDENKFVLKNMKHLAEDMKDDLKFAEEVDKAWERYDKGKFKSMEASKFLKEIEKW